MGEGVPFWSRCPDNLWFPSFVGHTNWPCLGGCGEGKLLPGLQSRPCPLCVLTCTPWTPLQGGQLFLP